MLYISTSNFNGKKKKKQEICSKIMQKTRFLSLHHNAVGLFYSQINEFFFLSNFHTLSPVNQLKHFWKSLRKILCCQQFSTPLPKPKMSFFFKKALFAYEKWWIIMILCQTLVKIYNSIAQTNLCHQKKLWRLKILQCCLKS